MAATKIVRSICAAERCFFIILNAQDKYADGKVHQPNRISKKNNTYTHSLCLSHWNFRWAREEKWLAQKKTRYHFLTCLTSQVAVHPQIVI